MRITYVCTNFNGAQFTHTAVESLLSNRGHQCSVVIVDNRSTQADVEELRRFASRLTDVHLLLNRENLGYFGGLNVGIRYARMRWPEINLYVVGNNDLIFHSKFVDSIEAARETFEQHPVVSPDVVTLAGTHQNPHAIDRISKRRALVYDLYYSNYQLSRVISEVARLTSVLTRRRDQEEWRTARQIHLGHGSCYLLGPVFFANFAELWAPSFLMGEEFFLSKQLGDRGFKIYYEPGIAVTHQDHKTVSTVPPRLIWENSRTAHKACRQLGAFDQCSG
jgi:GT2 family glycosyltransferase